MARKSLEDTVKALKMCPNTKTDTEHTRNCKACPYRNEFYNGGSNEKCYDVLMQDALNHMCEHGIITSV
jgi:hypothetical protein